MQRKSFSSINNNLSYYNHSDASTFKMVEQANFITTTSTFIALSRKTDRAVNVEELSTQLAVEGSKAFWLLLDAPHNKQGTEYLCAHFSLAQEKKISDHKRNFFEMNHSNENMCVHTRHTTIPQRPSSRSQ